MMRFRSPSRAQLLFLHVDHTLFILGSFFPESYASVMFFLLNERKGVLSAWAYTIENMMKSTDLRMARNRFLHFRRAGAILPGASFRAHLAGRRCAGEAESPDK
jgi:hypothetical protein